MKKSWKFLATLLLASATLTCATACTNIFKDWFPSFQSSPQEKVWSMERVYATAQELGFEGSLEDLIALFKGEQGVPGKDGKDGVGIKSISVNENGRLLITLSNDIVIDCGVVKGANGADGTQGLQGEKGDQGEQGPQGEKGDQGESGQDGEDGKDGVGVEKMEFDKDGNTVITYTDGSTQTIEHTWIKAFTLQEATCEEKGIDLYACADCSITRIVYEDVLGHDYVNKECAHCGEPQPSEGLTYTLSEDETYYSVTGIGTCEDTNIVIASTYKGKPVVTIGEGAFKNCYNNLTSVVIGNNVTSIGDRAFSNCINLTSVVIGDRVTTIGDRAFSNCNSLTSVDIPNSVKMIGNDAFSNCDNLMSVNIGDGVTWIGSFAFLDCTNMTSVKIPDGITTIGNSAFANCLNLMSVYYKGKAEDWKKISILDYNENLTNTTRYYYSENQPTEEGNYWYYDKNGKVAVWGYKPE